MKFRLKAFLVLLTIFVICLNAGMFYLAHATYAKQLRTTKQKALGEAYFIVSSLSNDLSSLKDNGDDSEENEEALFNLYAEYYKEKKITFGLYNDNWRKYSNYKVSMKMSKLLKVTDNDQKMMIQKVKGTNYLCIAQHLTGEQSTYTLVYVYSMKELDTSWKELLNLFVLSGIVITVVLAIVLYLVLRNLMKPLKRLTDATKEIVADHYGKTIEVKGKDEFAELSICFNDMSSHIKDNIQELEENNEKKQLLIDNMAHELRTPLTSISGYADYMLRANLDEEEQYESLQYIQSESKRLTKMSQTLLSLADIRNETIQMDLIPVEELKQHLLQLTKEMLERHEVVLQIQTEVKSIKGNRELVFSLMENLIENAARACEKNGEIVALIKQQEENLVIQVKDNGKGMNQEELAKIREPFYRVDKARSRRYGGVGLGVTLCYQIVACHNGTMHYESCPGEGTTVTIQWAM